MTGWFKFCASQLILTLLVGIILLTLYAGAGRQYLPYIDSFKPELTQWLSEKTKQPVEIGELIGSWSGLLPIVEIKDLKIGRDKPIYIAYLRAKLDVSASLFYQTPIFSRLKIDNLRASIKELGDKKWQLSKGWVVDASQSEQTDNDWLSLLLKQKSISISNWKITHQRLNKKIEHVHLDTLLLRNQGSQHSFSGQAKWGNKQLFPIDFKANLKGELWPYKQPSGRLYLNIAKHDWSRWIPPVESPKLSVSSFKASAKAWFRLEQGQLRSHYALMQVDNAQIKTSGKSLNITKGLLTVAGLGDEQGWYSVIDSNFSQKKQWPKVYVHHSRMPEMHGVKVEIKNINVSRVTSLLNTHKLLPEKAQNYVSGINPKGQINYFSLSYLYPKSKELDADMLINMELKEVSTQAYRGIPAFRHVSGRLNMNEKSGFFEVQDNLSSIYIDEAYHHWLDVEKPKGRFLWKLKEESADLILDNFSGSLQGHPAQAEMRLTIPYHKDKGEHLNLGLMVGLKSGPITLQKGLVPEVFVDKKTRSWLNNSVLSGQVSGFKLLLNGAIGPKTHLSERSLEIDFDTKNTHVRYQQGWPDIKQSKAHVSIRDTGIKAEIYKANSAGMSLVQPATLTLSEDKKRQIRLKLSAKVEGELDKGFAFLTDTPLKESINNQLEGWYMQGNHRSSFMLGLTLGDDASINPEFKLKSRLSNASIYIKPADLAVQKIRGDIQYSLKRGLVAKKLKAQTLGGDTNISIQSRIHKEGLKLDIHSKGMAQWDSIHQWYNTPFKALITGQANYNLDVTIDASETQEHSFNLATDLVGTDIRVPEPYGKSVTIKKPLSINWQIKSNESLLNVDYKGNISGRFKLNNAKIDSGTLRLDDKKAQLSAYKGVFIYADIKEPVILDKWLDVGKQLFLPTHSSDNDDALSFIREFKLNIADIRLREVNIGSSFISGTHLKDGWEIGLANRIAKGQVVLSNKPKTPLLVQLDYLHIKEVQNIDYDESSTKTDILESVDPASLPDMDIWLAEFYYNTRNLGNWHLTSRAKDQRYLINIEKGQIKNLAISAKLEWLKENDQHHSYLRGLNFQANDLAETQRAFRVTPILESKSFNLDAQASWLGTPANVKLENINAQINYEIKKGRIEVKEADSLRGFGALNFSAISRRLRLDFSDLYQSGLTFDEIKADLELDKGILNIKKPILIEGPSAKYVLLGKSNLIDKSVDMEMVVTLPVTSSLPLVVVLAGLSPPVAGAVYVTERLIGNELERFTSAKYSIKGTLDEPELKLINVFANKPKGEESPSFKERVKRIFFLD